jgi:uncharacterized membrane protein
MPSDSPITFEQPIWLFLLVLIVPAFLLSLRSIGGLSRRKTLVTFALRCLVIVLLTAAMAHPRWQKRGEGLTLTMILDRSESVPWPLKRESVEFLRQASEFKVRREDQVAVIAVARDPAPSQMPDVNSIVEVTQEPADLSATNLAEGVKMALAIMPDDTANRIVLASDGNENVDSVLAAAYLAAANGVPIDVMLLEYEHANEVILERLVAPARVRQGQSASVKVVLRSQTETPATVFLSMNGEPLDLDPEAPGDGRAVQLKPGPFVLPVTVSMDESGAQQFEARVEVPVQGDIPQNNAAVAVTFVSGTGRVLLVDDNPVETEPLMRVLRGAGIAAERTSTDAMMGGLAYLSGFDAVVLANVPRWAFDDEQDVMLHAYVHDMGGGLVMLGGPASFGAGGWIDSETARVLPLNLDPPSTQQMPRGALALIMHSCEMPQGNFWGQKVAEAAIEALSRLDLVGIIEYGWGGQAGGGRVAGVNNCVWAFPLQEVGNKQAALAATKQLQMGDMPDFDASMQTALQGLQGTRAAQKHVIIISDGDPQPPSAGVLQQFVQGQISVTTVMVGGHGTTSDQAKMQNVAAKTGGRYYNVTNPKNLPQIFIKEAKIVSRSLIQEDLYQPQVVSRMPGPLEGYSAVPQIEGYVLTAPRDGLAQTPIINPTSEGKDPIYAYWNYGLGKSIAYTSDLQGRWGAAWVAWPRFQGFWEQSIRWVMRPSAPANMHVNTRVDGDTAVVELEALNPDASFMTLLNASAVVVAPRGEGAPLPLSQTGPGRYRGEFPAQEAGAYLVNIAYAGGTVEAPLRGNLQAAVSVPYSPEYRTVKHNAALLRELVDRTRGRWIEPGDPALAALFELGTLEMPRTHRRIWDLLAVIAASLFLIDVAARRLAIDPRWLSAVARRAVANRGEASTATVAAWRRTRQQVRGGRGSEEAPAPGTTFEASAQDRAVAIDAGREMEGGARGPAAPQRPEAAGAAPPAKPQEGEYTSRLLQAKRRARKPEGEEPPDG